MTQQHPTGKPAQFDMFIGHANGEEGSGYSPSLVRRVKSHPMQEAEMLAHLAATGRYRILHRLKPRQVAGSVRPEYPLHGIIDTETTGLDHRRNEIIEFGVIAFTFDERGVIGDITGVFGGLQQPAPTIPAEITKITGITDAVDQDGFVLDGLVQSRRNAKAAKRLMRKLLKDKAVRFA